MNRPEELDVGEAVAQLGDGPADLANRLAEAVAPVCRYQDQPLVGVEIDSDGKIAIGRLKKCVNHRVARDEDCARADSFSLQVCACRQLWERNAKHSGEM